MRASRAPCGVAKFEVFENLGQKLLGWLAEATRSAVTLKLLEEDELPGCVGDFVLLAPLGCPDRVLPLAEVRAFAARLLHAEGIGSSAPRVDAVIQEMIADLLPRPGRGRRVVVPSPKWADAFDGAAQ